jgi:8-oxo-dGTP pyrophosphatase MutT (NUDIX family)
MQVDFDTLIYRLKERLTKPLPGATAQDVMRAEPVGAFRPKFEHKIPPKAGAVLLLLYPDNGQIKFPLTKRPEYIGTHGGQVSFPGGKAEAGETSEQTALREGQEEIGIDPTQVEIIGRLTNLFVIPSNFMVTPIVAFQKAKGVFKPDPVEVVRIMEGSLNDLLKEGAIQRKEILAAGIYPLSAPHFLIDNEIVWGATSMMLNEFRVILQEVC